MSRREHFSVGSIVHVLNRGAKKMPIFRQKSDLQRLMFSLFYLNSTNLPENWTRELENKGSIENLKWPHGWGERKPLVSVLAFTIMPNHFHFILKEIKNGGISQFMHKLTMAHSKFINAKYNESGSLFQGKFKSTLVESDEYLRYLATYVMVKNTLELYPNGGITKAVKEFDKGYQWAIEYPFTSLADYAGTGHSLIIDKDILGEIFKHPNDFKKFAKDCILGRKFEVIGLMSEHE